MTLKVWLFVISVGAVWIVSIAWMISAPPLVHSLPMTYTPSQQPGERKGDRCFNGKFWTTCVVSPPPELAERVPFVTRTWHVAHLAEDRPKDGMKGYYQVRVDVIETEGTCIYISRGWLQPTHNLSIIPKSQLPKGVGCQ